MHVLTLIENDHIPHWFNKDLLYDGLCKTLCCENITLFVEVNCLITTNEEITQLNTDYLKKNKPTNVLSFPHLENDELKKLKSKNTDIIFLGDIALSLDYINEEAHTQKKDPMNHLLHLFIHSLLHLLGYDHINEKCAAEMEEKEINILKMFNIQNPYEI